MKVRRILYIEGFSTMGPPSPDAVLVELSEGDRWQIFRANLPGSEDEDLRIRLGKALQELGRQLELHGEHNAPLVSVYLDKDGKPTTEI